ncbi:hypothetical protein Aple_082390 [Acrocarpospora pleiomorpha]|uniref:Uncharacterized protein n=1 Tax=Acrocarpospora pleiomorpha TaxID=90975 RepID=A0A5M3XWJ9_9ACTN|nr:hypothetical protein Aple_082390 [Acrocarpospora pleiomorpha]
MVERWTPEGLKIFDHKVRELLIGHRRQDRSRSFAPQNQAELMKLTPRHRRDGFAHQLLMRPAEMYTRKVSDLSLDEVRAVQFGCKGGRLAQLPVHSL